ncbi:hypothetical protein ANN_21444 [Periplaneta americana]|uniref:Uncharacterized protein n=1 Tax=Periplaneta americana TaxID=6978 RepID=A0ABQ8SFE3_PERAM|nr:hypothetical protein ANN_21444 [Periplaneta americana]
MPGPATGRSKPTEGGTSQSNEEISRPVSTKETRRREAKKTTKKRKQRGYQESSDSDEDGRHSTKDSSDEWVEEKDNNDNDNFDDPKPGDRLLVKFPTKNTIKFYVGCIEELVPGEGLELRFVRIVLDSSSNILRWRIMRNIYYHEKAATIASLRFARGSETRAQRASELPEMTSQGIELTTTTAEPNKIPIFLQDSDKLIRSALKQIPQLPTDTPDHMLYSDMKCKGLGLFKAEWEAHLQHANTCRVLALSANPYVTATRDVFSESTECVKSLQLTETSDVTKDPRTSLYDARRMRKKLRE